MTPRRDVGGAVALGRVTELTGSLVLGARSDYALTGQHPISGRGRSPAT
jgi:hypothetical protein